MAFLSLLFLSHFLSSFPYERNRWQRSVKIRLQENFNFPEHKGQTRHADNTFWKIISTLVSPFLKP